MSTKQSMMPSYLMRHMRKLFCQEQATGHKKEHRVDVIWYYLEKMRSPVGPNYRFKLLFEVAGIVLTIPHSNAGIERLFSLVNKNENESSDRNRLDVEGSLSSMFTVKLERPESKEKC